MHSLTLDRAALDEMLAHAREAHPEECCGAVITRDDRDHVLRFTNIQNRLHAQSPEEYPRTAERGYTPDPKDQFAAERAGREPGARLSVFYHSHPITGAYFSGEDRARAMRARTRSDPDCTGRWSCGITAGHSAMRLREGEQVSTLAPVVEADATEAETTGAPSENGDAPA